MKILVLKIILMENQENQVQSKEPQNKEPQKKEKNPKRVAAGKKGAEARWNKQKAMQAALQAAQETEQDEAVKETREPQETQSAPPLKVNVYKNYIPLCAVLIGIVGVGIYMSRGDMSRDEKPEMRQVTQAPEIRQGCRSFRNEII